MELGRTAAAWPLMDAIMTAKTGGVIAMGAMGVHRLLSSVLMAAVFIMRIVQLHVRPVQLLFALASQDMRGIWIATVMVSVANNGESRFRAIVAMLEESS